jgi:hypothetical protein
VRKLAAVLTIGMAVIGGSVAAADTSEDPLTVTIHVINYAGISEKELVAAESYAAAIYRAAGISTVWTNTLWTPGRGRSPHFTVAILSNKMTLKKCEDSRLAASVMGTAIYRRPDDSGGIAYVFADRIGRTAMEHLAKFDQGLGHAMAHEVGHLLLGAHHHAPAGLMAPDWKPREKRLATFTPRQIQVIRDRTTATEGR